mmetsp:Transcript_48823/g.156954  ORF Transcript_48823/g.156954 Transcript_48823/m.156954 type:complete len:340 (-) Transcript_48823:291-1310(-)
MANRSLKMEEDCSSPQARWSSAKCDRASRTLSSKVPSMASTRSLCATLGTASSSSNLRSTSRSLELSPPLRANSSRGWSCSGDGQTSSSNSAAACASTATTAGAEPTPPSLPTRSPAGAELEEAEPDEVAWRFVKASANAVVSAPSLARAIATFWAAGLDSNSSRFGTVSRRRRETCPPPLLGCGAKAPSKALRSTEAVRSMPMGSAPSLPQAPSAEGAARVRPATGLRAAASSSAAPLKASASVPTTELRESRRPMGNLDAGSALLAPRRGGPAALALPDGGGGGGAPLPAPLAAPLPAPLARSLALATATCASRAASSSSTSTIASSSSWKPSSVSK